MVEVRGFWFSPCAASLLSVWDVWHESYTHRLVPLWMPFSLRNWPSTCNNSLLYSLSIAYLNNLFWKLYLSVPPGKLFHLALKVLSSSNSSCTWRTCSNIWLWSLLRNSTLVFELHLWPVDCCILINKAEKSHTVQCYPLIPSALGWTVENEHLKLCVVQKLETFSSGTLWFLCVSWPCTSCWLSALHTVDEK